MGNENKGKSSPASGLRTGLIIAVLGLVVGAGLYALFGGIGKPDGPKTADTTGSAAQCELSAARRAAIDAAAKGEVAAFTMVDEPSSVTGLSFNDAGGSKVSLADWKGKTVLLNLWATWCAPCRREMPSLDALQRDLGSETFQVLPVSLDLGSDEKPKGFYKQVGLKDLPFYHDGSLETLTTLKKRGLALGLPATLLIDPAGCVIGKLNGPAEWASEDAKALIDAALQ